MRSLFRSRVQLSTAAKIKIALGKGKIHQVIYLLSQVSDDDDDLQLASAADEQLTVEERLRLRALVRVLKHESILTTDIKQALQKFSDQNDPSFRKIRNRISLDDLAFFKSIYKHKRLTDEAKFYLAKGLLRQLDAQTCEQVRSYVPRKKLPACYVGYGISFLLALSLGILTGASALALLLPLSLPLALVVGIGLVLPNAAYAIWLIGSRTIPQAMIGRKTLLDWKKLSARQKGIVGAITLFCTTSVAAAFGVLVHYAMAVVIPAILLKAGISLGVVGAVLFSPITIGILAVATAIGFAIVFSGSATQLAKSNIFRSVRNYFHDNFKEDNARYASYIDRAKQSRRDKWLTGIVLTIATGAVATCLVTTMVGAAALIAPTFLPLAIAVGILGAIPLLFTYIKATVSAIEKYTLSSPVVDSAASSVSWRQQAVISLKSVPKAILHALCFSLPFSLLIHTILAVKRRVQLYQIEKKESRTVTMLKQYGIDPLSVEILTDNNGNKFIVFPADKAAAFTDTQAWARYINAAAYGCISTSRALGQLGSAKVVGGIVGGISFFGGAVASSSLVLLTSKPPTENFAQRDKRVNAGWSGDFSFRSRGGRFANDGRAFLLFKAPACNRARTAEGVGESNVAVIPIA